MQRTDPRNSNSGDIDPAEERVFLEIQRTVLTNVIGSMLDASEEIGQAFHEHGEHDPEETKEIYEAEESKDDRHM